MCEGMYVGKRERVFVCVCLCVRVHVSACLKVKMLRRWCILL